jgi:hypothetical protein
MGRVEPHTGRARHGDHSEAFIGIDTAKLRNAVAIAEAGRRGEVRYLGEVDASEAATRKLIAKLAARYGKLTFFYEAGPTGYGLYRLIESLGNTCIMAVPTQGYRFVTPVVTANAEIALRKLPVPGSRGTWSATHKQCRRVPRLSS